MSSTSKESIHVIHCSSAGSKLKTKHSFRAMSSVDKSLKRKNFGLGGERNHLCETSVILFSRRWVWDVDEETWRNIVWFVCSKPLSQWGNDVEWCEIQCAPIARKSFCKKVRVANRYLALTCWNYHHQSSPSLPPSSSLSPSSPSSPPPACHSPPILAGLELLLHVALTLRLGVAAKDIVGLRHPPFVLPAPRPRGLAGLKPISYCCWRLSRINMNQLQFNHPWGTNDSFSAI